MDNVPVLYPLKTPGNQRFSGVIMGYKMGTLTRNGVKNHRDVIETKLIHPFFIKF